MTTWRDMTDQLTPEQVGLLEQLEQDPLPGGLLSSPAHHLAFARGWACENLEQSLHADVPTPAGAVEVDEWRKSSDGVRRRSFRSAVLSVDGDGITLEIHGSQDTDGRITGHVALLGDGLGKLDPDAAREIAAALWEAADRIEGA
ncbi:MAG: hypothetical protein ACR2JI_16960 [Mycobacterium sp.]